MSKAPASADDPDSNEIVVRAAEGDHSLIDRDTYVVRDTPLAQTKSALDIIRNLPPVSIDAAGQLRLLGSKNVKILIDGRDVSDPGMVSALQATQIARVEVMTNPSAKFSSYGSAGIINIILRRKFADSLGGSTTAGIGNPGYVSAKASPTWSNREWSLTASPSVSSTGNHADTSLVRVAEPSRPGLNRSEDSIERGHSRSISVMGDASFKPDARRRYGLSGSFSQLDGDSRRTIEVSSPSGAYAPFVETSRGRTSLGAKSASLEQTVEGRREGEELTHSLSFSSYEISSNNLYADRLAAGVRQIELVNSLRVSRLGLKSDYVLPLSRKSTLSVGGELQGEWQSIRDSAIGDLSSGPVNSRNVFAGRWFDISAYATLQADIGTLKVLPGLRVQRRRFRFDKASDIAPTGAILAFPSLHVQRKFGKVIGSFSITERADWPAIGLFLPYKRITGPTTADTGSPELRPERTLGLEVAARGALAGQQLSLTFYSRRRENVRDTAIAAIDAGELLSRPVSIGSRVSNGGQFVARGKLFPNLRYSLAGWFADAEFDRLDGGRNIRQHAMEYGGNGQIDVFHGKEGVPGFGQVTLNLRYFGPTEDLQSQTSEILAVDVSYTHSLSRRISAVATIDRLLGTRVITIAKFGTNFDEISRSKLYGPIFRLSLTYKLGKLQALGGP